MKIWEFAKAEGSRIKVDNWMSDTMGLVDGGCVYSTLFKHPDQGPKDYEIILSMFPQENYRTLAHVTMYLDDVPGSSAQAADFLAKKEINILNSISLNGISDTVIVWKIMADLNFAGEGDMLVEYFESLKAKGDPSVSKIRRIDVKPAEIGRLFKSGYSSNGKQEVRRGYPMTIADGCFDVAVQYGDILGDIDGKNALITIDADSWIMSITIFKPDTRLVKVGITIPDCPGGITQMLGVIAGWNVNLISVFSKIKVCYQSMYLELFMDIGKSDMSAEDASRGDVKAQRGVRAGGVHRDELKHQGDGLRNPLKPIPLTIFPHTFYINYSGNNDMRISRYSRMDTTVRPGSFLSVVYVSEGEGEGLDAEEIVAQIRADIDAIDGVAVSSEDSDPLSVKGLYKLLKRLKLPGRDLVLVTDGSEYSDLDDLVGAGYVNYVNLEVDGPLDKSQAECVRILDNCGCPYMVTATLIPGRISESALRELASEIPGSRHLILKAGKSPDPARKLDQKELASLASSVRGLAKDVRLVMR